MKKNGFTLIELLGVIIILTAIFMIAVPNIASSVNKAEEQGIKTSINNLVKGANNYFDLNVFDIPAYGSNLELHDIVELKEGEYVEKLPVDSEGVFFLIYTDQYTYVPHVILTYEGTYYSSIEKMENNCSLYSGLCSTSYRDYYTKYCTCN